MKIEELLETIDHYSESMPYEKWLDQLNACPTRESKLVFLKDLTKRTVKNCTVANLLVVAKEAEKQLIQSGYDVKINLNYKA